jgi:hypothetical protein
MALTKSRFDARNLHDAVLHVGRFELLAEHDLCAAAT